jgi:hypothetical protein
MNKVTMSHTVINARDIAISKFRLGEGNLMFSKIQMTQAEALEKAKVIKGYHVTSDIEIDILERKNSEVKLLVDKSYIVTSKRGLQHGGPFETPFIHADEVETSYSLALFPELMKMEDAVDADVYGFLPNHGRHIDKAANAYQRPIAWYGQMGASAMEIYAYPKGVVGKATLAKAEKAYPGVEAILDYMVELHDDIMKKFPAGVLPPIEQVTNRNREDIEAVIKGPLNGGRHIYTLAYPP